MTKPKVVNKPWGKEIWLELNDKYCYKRIHINAGTKTSYQYHERKLETNFIIEGKAEVWLENNEGIVEKSIMNAGDYFTVIPPKKHRVIAITDIILQEVSTPEVDDVIRISDDSGRGQGKIGHEHESPVLCILAAGIGSRLESYSEHINKGLLPLNNKSIITNLIEKIPDSYEIVIILGYKGEMVEEYCLAAHPDRDFKFISVDKYEGNGTGPGYSIRQAKEVLQRPFIWVTSDTVVTDDFPAANHNWLGVYPTSLPELYSTVNIKEGNIVGFKNKSKSGYGYAFIGAAGVYDYKTFWEELNGCEIVSAYSNIDKYPNMKGHEFNWYDVGTLDNYFRAKNIYETSVQYSIPKTNGEFLYHVGDRFIKLSSDKKFIEGRIKRAGVLANIIPKINFKGSYLYSYEWVDGVTLYDSDNISIWEKFLDFMRKSMWEVLDENIYEGCVKFYKDKTMARLKMFLSSRAISYQGEHIVNKVATSPIGTLLDNFDWNKIYTGIPTKLFHGDLQFDNVIVTKDNDFCLIDWRQDFANIGIGDVYYDLAKMYGGILMSYKLMKDESNYSCSFENGKEATYSYKNSQKLNEFRPFYEKWISQNQYDLTKVKMITALIFLNMSPLHEKEFGDLLFFKSKQMLEALNG
jgi:mannose-6-phosphate isomerase-like protein (cupin superfamily)/thiamine kinase-like enzyme